MRGKYITEDYKEICSECKTMIHMGFGHCGDLHRIAHDNITYNQDGTIFDWSLRCSKCHSRWAGEMLTGMDWVFCKKCGHKLHTAKYYTVGCTKCSKFNGLI